MKVQMDNEKRRQELGDFVRTRRERISPSEAGLPAGKTRRTPGLRREEVALLAGVSVTWYTWLEQGRGINVSAAVLESIARVLKLDGTERAHLFMLAQQTPPPSAPFEEAVSPALQRVLDHQGISPAFIVGRRWDILAWNRAASAVFGNFEAMPERERNLVWLSFTEPAMRRLIVDWESHAQCVLAQFRAGYGLHPDDPWCSQLINDLQKLSPEFAAWWPRHDVREMPGGRKEFQHPAAGKLVLEDSLFQVAGSPDLRLFLYVPTEEENTSAKLRRLIAKK